MIELATTTQDPSAKAGFDLIYLVTCSLHGIVPEQNKVEHLDLTLLYRMAEYHSLTAMVCMALEAANAFSYCQDTDLVKKWKDTKEKAIRKNLMLDAERREILNFMERRGIWNMPLKGILIKEMYPKLGMRQMADNDILYDKKYQKELWEFMKSRGYEALDYGKGNHDVYQKAPIYNYELHTSLYSSENDRNWGEYYGNVKQRLIKDDNNSTGYHFREEDFYIYIMTHACKHYNGGGTGLRSLLDFYVLLQQKEAELNWHYIALELDTLCITEFERESRELCKKLFSVNTNLLTQKESEILNYYLGSGTYGTMKNSIEKKIRKFQSDNKPVTAATRMKYYRRRLFPDMEHYKNYAPFVYRHQWLIPFYLVFRFVRGLIRKGEKIRNEIRYVHKMD